MSKKFLQISVEEEGKLRELNTHSSSQKTKWGSGDDYQDYRSSDKKLSTKTLSNVSQLVDLTTKTESTSLNPSHVDFSVEIGAFCHSK